MLAESNVLLVLALILVAGVVSGALAKLARLPSVTGQILFGVLPCHVATKMIQPRPVLHREPPFPCPAKEH